MLAAVMSLTAFMGIGATTAFAAVGEKADVYLCLLYTSMEVLKSHLCKQRNIKLVKLPFKTTETEAEYSDRVKAVFKSVHIFIYSDVEVDVSVIKRRFDEWPQSCPL